jgi:hypothetical protein
MTRNQKTENRKQAWNEAFYGRRKGPADFAAAQEFKETNKS